MPYLFIDLIAYLFFLPIVALPVVIVLGCVKKNNYKLKDKFLSLQPIIGKTYGEIVLAVGSPDSSMLMTDKISKQQVRVCKWINTNCNITLIFDLNNICVEVAPTTTIN